MAKSTKMGGNDDINAQLEDIDILFSRLLAENYMLQVLSQNHAGFIRKHPLTNFCIQFSVLFNATLSALLPETASHPTFFSCPQS
jgi:hypothetical protein